MLLPVPGCGQLRQLMMPLILRCNKLLIFVFFRNHNFVQIVIVEISEIICCSSTKMRPDFAVCSKMR